MGTPEQRRQRMQEAHQLVEEAYNAVEKLQEENPVPSPHAFTVLTLKEYRKEMKHHPDIATNVAHHRAALNIWLGPLADSIGRSQTVAQALKATILDAHGKIPAFGRSHAQELDKSELEKAFKGLVKASGSPQKAREMLAQVQSRLNTLQPQVNVLVARTHTTGMNQPAHVIYHTFHGLNAVLARLQLQ